MNAVANTAHTPAAVAESLVQRCVLGEHQAWRDLHRTYYPVAAAFLRKLGVREPELEDACQDVFVRMFRYLPTFRGASELKTWLYRLCITEAGVCRRRRGLLTTIKEILQQGAMEPAVCGPDMSPETARAKVELALAALKPADRDVFVLYELEGVSGEEIASIVGCPVATVWRRLHYGRREFQARFAMMTGGDP